MPTTVNWEEEGITVQQDTNFPSEYSTLTVNGSGDFTMKLRVPYWATAGFEVKVNGESVCTNPEVSTYVEISRTWSDGDVVTIHMPYTLHLDKTPDKVDGSTVASIMYGPLVMVAKDDRDTYVPMNWYNVVLSENLEDSITVVTGTDSEDVPHLTTNGLHFYPMYDAYNYRYHAYVKVEETQSVVNKDALQDLIDAITTGDDIPSQDDYTAEQWAALQAAIADAKEVLGDENATQVDVYQKYKALQAALADTTVNKSDLQTAVDNALPDSDKDKYSADTWEAYQQALTEAKRVLADENATKEDVLAALADLEAAEKALKPIDDGKDPEPTDKPDPTEKPSTTTTPGGSTGKPGTSGKPGGANTGDNSPIMATTVALILGLGGAVALVAYKKRRHA